MTHRVIRPASQVAGAKPVLAPIKLSDWTDTMPVSEIRSQGTAGSWGQGGMFAFRIGVGAVLGFSAVLWPGSVIAGPPFRTDDPEPVAYKHWEFYTFFSGTRVAGNTSGVGPAFEFNYGLIPDGQLHIVAPLAFSSSSGSPTQFGYGDTELGFKYRFIQEDEKGWRPQVGVFPFLEVPKGSEGRGLGAGHIRAYLPIWVQKSFGDWTTYGGGGYWINQDGNLGDRNYWFFGWLLQRKITEHLTLGAEVFHQSADNIQAVDSTGFNIGGVYDFDEHNHLLFSAGRGFQHAPETNVYSWYFAWQVTY